jgi:hypothetical protein
MSKFLVTLVVEAQDLDAAIQEVAEVLADAGETSMRIVAHQRANTQY